MNGMYMKEDGVRAWGVRFFVTGGTPLAQDSSVISGISSRSFVIARSKEEAIEICTEEMEKVIESTCEDAGLHIEVFDIVKSFYALEDRHEDAHMVIDDLIHVVYHMSGREGSPEHIKDFLENCDRAIGVRSRNYENPVMAARARGYVEGD
jgi:hypothetical protein